MINNDIMISLGKPDGSLLPHLVSCTWTFYNFMSIEGLSAELFLLNFADSIIKNVLASRTFESVLSALNSLCTKAIKKGKLASIPF